WLPAALLVLLALLEARALPVLDFLVPAFPLLFLPALWFLAIRILGSCLSGLSLRHGVVFVRSIRIFSVYSARIDPKHIIGVQYLQNPLQRFSGRCTLVLQTSGGWPAQYKLYHVPLKEARRWVQNSLGVSSGD
ncbi:MAG TPA: PH domain-containing protein, partial [Firmicutes bacterium]|nr:PH domain-containing protein [Bacillota bacterium]